MYSKYIQIESSGVLRIPKMYLLGSLYFSKDIQYKLSSNQWIHNLVKCYQF